MVYNFDIDVAKEYGVNEAIMIANLQFWIMKNKANQVNYMDGHYWTYNSISAFCELFPFWSVQNIKTILNHLKEKGIIVVGNYNKSKYDKTNWYAFKDEEYWLKGGKKEKNIESIDWLESNNQEVDSNHPIPDNKHRLNKNGKPFLYIGEFKNVKLTKEEFEKLVEKYGWYFEDAVEALSAYLAAKGDKYKDHYAVMKEKNWVWEKVHKDPDCGVGRCEFIIDEKMGVSRIKTPLEYYGDLYNIEK